MRGEAEAEGDGKGEGERVKSDDGDGGDGDGDSDGGDCGDCGDGDGVNQHINQSINRNVEISHAQIDYLKGKTPPGYVRYKHQIGFYFPKK